MARLPPFITRIEGKRGVRYEARINATLPGGDRLQNRKRFKTVEEARDWHSTITAELAAGTHTPPSDLTVREAIEAWLTAKALRVKPTTSDAYTAATATATPRFRPSPSMTWRC